MTVTSFTVCLTERMVCRKRRRLKKARMELEGELCLPSVADSGMFLAVQNSSIGDLVTD